MIELGAPTVPSRPGTPQNHGGGFRGVDPLGPLASAVRLSLAAAQRMGDIVTVEARAVIAFNQQGHAAMILDVLGPAKSFVKLRIFLE
jgi:hypothetical protein